MASFRVRERGRSKPQRARRRSPSLIPEALPAVTVPSFLNAGFNAASFSSGIGARILVDRKANRVAPALRNVDRNDFGRERASGHSLRRPALALEGKGVLVRPAHVEACGNFLGGDTHVRGIDGARQAITHHRVDDVGIAHAVAPTRLREQVRRIRHGFGSTRDNRANITRPNSLNAVHHRLQPRAAHTRFTVSAGTSFDNPPSARRPPRDIHAGASLQHTPQIHITDLVGGNVGAHNRVAHDDSRKIG